MAYIVKEADVQKEKHIMVEILQQNRQRDAFDYGARYDWIYLNNPLGKARAWIIWNEKNNEAVGFTGVFPRAVYVNGRRYVGWNCGDFSIQKKYRTLGVALKLRRAAKEAVDSGQVPFLYAHPNARMEVIHLKVGHKKIAHMQRYAVLLRADRLIARFVPGKFWQKMISVPLNGMLATQYRFVGTEGWSAKLHPAVAAGAAHEALFRTMVERFAVIASRDAEYLNWKFAENPNNRYRQLDAYKYGELSGVFFFYIKEDTIYLVDVLLKDMEENAAALFALFLKTVVKEFTRLTSVSFILQEYNPLIPVFKALGFRLRNDGTSGVIAYAASDLAQDILDGTKWYMTVGDRDA